MKKEEHNKEREPKTSAEIPESEKSDFLKRLEKIKGGPVVFDTHSYPDDVEVEDDEDED